VINGWACGALDSEAHGERFQEREVQCRKGRIVITKGGKPVAALIDVALFERLRKLDEELEQLSGALAKAFAGMARRKAARSSTRP